MPWMKLQANAAPFNIRRLSRWIERQKDRVIDGKAFSVIRNQNLWTETLGNFQKKINSKVVKVVKVVKKRIKYGKCQ